VFRFVLMKKLGIAEALTFDKHFTKLVFEIALAEVLWLALQTNCQPPPDGDLLQDQFAEEIDEHLRSVKNPTERRTIARLLREISALRWSTPAPRSKPAR
jgi:hypothetical protein